MIGRTLKNRYQILEILAQGAGSTTYKAHDNTLNRDVSLKVLPTLYSAARERFFQQARRAAQLSHPNIAAVYEVDIGDDGTPFVVSEYVEGKPLSGLAPMPPQEVVRLGQQIAAALDYAHQQGIIHADLNTANIRVTPDGQVKVLDLGLRLAETASSTVTATGALIANPAYLSPEQIQGVKVDVRSDIYALGVILYELATGEPPFKGDTPMVVLIQHIKQPPAPPSTLAPAVPPDMDAAILRTLEKDPAQRYQSADALASALHEIAARRDLKSAPPPSDDDELALDDLVTLDKEVKESSDRLDDVDRAASPPGTVLPPAPIPPAVPKMEEKKDMFGGAPPSPVYDAPAPPPQPAETAAEQSEVSAQPFDPAKPTASMPSAPLPAQPRPAMPAPSQSIPAVPVPADEKAKSETSPAQPAAPEPASGGAGEGALPPPPQAAPQPAKPGAAVPTAPPPPVAAQPAQPEPLERQREEVGFDRSTQVGAAPKPQPVHFSAHYPKEVKPDDWQPLHAYLYKESAEKIVTEDASKQLGEHAPLFRKLVQTAKQVIQEGELVTATPDVPGFQFNPPSVSVAFFEDWHRFDFKLRAHTAPLNQAANGLLTFSVAGVIVADIPLAIFVGQSASATEQTSAAARPYQAIFCSYSHDDTQIVERVERAYKALGLDYLRDVVSLKSGTHWSEELLQLIEKADIFQLFWSDAAATSPYVKQEWEYALKLNRDNAHFIRPVYWRQPMPSPPQPMNHIHFAYQPDLEK